MVQKRVFVTGAAGFIGFHLAKHLTERGDIVVGYDNFNDYYLPNLKRAREHELQKIGVDVLNGDIEDADRLLRALEAFQPTHIAHLAAQAGVRYSVTHPDICAKVNLTGFMTVLEACRKFPHVKLVYASSSSVYGLNEKVPFSVSDSTDKPASLYGVTKKANELMAHAYHHLYGIPITGLRFFTVYGPWGRPDMAYYTFTQAILEGRPIQVFNDGKMHRDFTYIDDIITGTTAALDTCRGYHVYNLGNDQPVELNTFIATIEKAIGKSAIKVNQPMQAGDVLMTWADISLSRQALNYRPATSLERGIPLFVDWYRRYMIA